VHIKSLHIIIIIITAVLQRPIAYFSQSYFRSLAECCALQRNEDICRALRIQRKRRSVAESLKINVCSYRHQAMITATTAVRRHKTHNNQTVSVCHAVSAF